MFFNSDIGIFGVELDKNMSFVLNKDFRYLPQIFCVFSEKHKRSKQKAATFLKNILENLSFNDIIKIDAQMRQTTSMEYFINWSKLEITDLLLPTMSKEEKRAVLIFASFSPNGYMREKAVYLLAKYEMSLPYILLRKNDWVRQVREAANKSFIYRLNHLSDGELLASLPFVEKLNRSIRADYEKKNMKNFYNVLLKPENKNQLNLGLTSKDLYIRRLCLNIILNADNSDIELILKHIKCEKIPQIKFMAYKKFLTLDNCPVDMILKEMLFEKYPKTRSNALQYIYEQNKLNSYNIAINFLLDKSASVRNTARWIIFSCNKEFNFLNYYATNLFANPYSSICGIRETGKKTDAVLIKSYLYSDIVSIVRVTMRTLMFLDATNYSLDIVKMLEDNRVGIVKEAFQLLRYYGINSCIKEVYSLFKNTQNTNTRYKCAVLLFKSTKWDSIIYILEEISNQDKAISQLSKTALSNWNVTFNRSFTKPNLTQKQKIVQLLNLQYSLIDRKSIDNFLFAVKPFIV